MDRYKCRFLKCRVVYWLTWNVSNIFGLLLAFVDCDGCLVPEHIPVEQEDEYLRMKRRKVNGSVK